MSSNRVGGACRETSDISDPDFEIAISSGSA